MIFVFSLVTPFNKAEAASFADIPGYADEAFKSVITGVMVAGGAAAHAGNYVEDNLKAIVDTAGLTYDSLAPEAKQLFLDSLSASADGIVIAGNWIEDFLSRAALNDQLAPPQQADISGTFKQANATFTALSGYGFAYNGSVFKYVSFGFDNATTGKLRISIGGVHTVSKVVGPALFNQFFNTMDGSHTSPALLSTVIAQFAVSVTTSSGAALDLPTGQLDNIRDHINDKIRAEGGSYRLGVPAGSLVETWANTATGAQRVYYDATQDLWTLPDGTPIPRDQIQVKARAQGMYGDTSVVVGSDGALYDLTTGDKVASRDDAQTSGVAIPGDITKEWEFQDTLTKNPAKEESKDDAVTGEGLSGFFSKLWDWLKKILNAILAIPKAIIDLLKALLLLLFVPTDGFWSDNFNGIRDALTKKLGVGDLLEDVDSLSSGGGGAFKDVIVTLMGVSNLEVIDADSVNKVLSYIHKWVRGVVFPMLLFYNINQMYKLIRGSSLIEATRAFRSSSKGD